MLFWLDNKQKFTDIMMNETNPFENGTNAAADSHQCRGPTTAISVAQILLDSEEMADEFWKTKKSERQKIAQFCYSHAVLLQTGIALASATVVYGVQPNVLRKEQPISSATICIVVGIQFFNIAVFMLSQYGMIVELRELFVRTWKVCFMYISTCMFYASLYFASFVLSTDAFAIDGYEPNAADVVDPYSGPSDVASTSDPFSIFCYFIYFSGTAMTSTGFGDIVPKLWYTQLLVITQMLCGTVFHIAVFGLALQHFRTFQKIQKLNASFMVSPAETNVIMFSNLRQWMESHGLLHVFARLLPLITSARRLALEYLLVWSILSQLIQMSLLFSIPHPFSSISSGTPGYIKKLVVLAIIVTCLLIQAAFMVYISINLAKRIGSNEVTASFLMQTYLSVCLLFAGIYLTYFAAIPSHQFYRADNFQGGTFTVVYTFCHFSITVATTTGFGDVYARGLVARLTVVVEMWCAILLTCVVAGLGASTIIDFKTAEAVQMLHENSELIHQQVLDSEYPFNAPQRDDHLLDNAASFDSNIFLNISEDDENKISSNSVDIDNLTPISIEKTPNNLDGYVHEGKSSQPMFQTSEEVQPNETASNWSIIDDQVINDAINDIADTDSSNSKLNVSDDASNILVNRTRHHAHHWSIEMQQTFASSTRINAIALSPPINRGLLQNCTSFSPQVARRNQPTVSPNNISPLLSQTIRRFDVLSYDFPILIAIQIIVDVSGFVTIRFRFQSYSASRCE